MNPFQIMRQRRELVLNLTKRELKIRYRGSVLGFLWTVLIPLFMAAIYVCFLRLLAGRGVPLPEIIIGVFAWQYTVQCVNSGLQSVTGNVNLVKKVAVPRFILPLSATLANTANYMLSLVVQVPLLAVLMYMNDAALSAWYFALPLVLVFHLMFNLALALFLSASHVYFRDTEHLVNVGLTAFFFLSPVMYNIGFIEHMASSYPWLMDVYMLNPVAAVITGYRALVLPTLDFPWSVSSVIALAACPVLLVVAYFTFQRAQRNFADLL